MSTPHSPVEPNYHAQFTVCPPCDDVLLSPSLGVPDNKNVANKVTSVSKDPEVAQDPIPPYQPESNISSPLFSGQRVEYFVALDSDDVQLLPFLGVPDNKM